MKNVELAVAAEKDYKKQIENKKASLSISIGYAVGAAKIGTAQAEETGLRVEAAPPQEISGDTAISCRLPEGSRALILSDGMGKGIKAAAESGLAVSLLRRLLKQGVAPAAAIKTVNQKLISQDGEAFATIDLTIVDLTTGKARFYKMGAAASYIVRGSRVRKIQRAALPVGIIPYLRLTHEAVNLLPGDIIVMVSDGITESDREDCEADWVVKFLTEIHSKDEHKSGPRQLAQLLLSEAQNRYGDRETDDSTVIAAAVRQAD